MSKWEVTLFKTTQIEAENRWRAIDKAIQGFGQELDTDSIEARKIRKMEFVWITPSTHFLFFLMAFSNKDGHPN